MRGAGPAWRRTPRRCAPRAAGCCQHDAFLASTLTPPAAGFFSELADAGIAVYTFDAVGHGRSEGERALVNRFEDMVDDFEALSNDVRKEIGERFPEVAPQLPYFLGGQSLGGLVSATLCARNQTRWAGLLIFSPAMDMEWTLVLRWGRL